MRKATFLTYVHNGERFVEDTIKSVLNQTEPDFWYFIRLNACTDGSEEIVRKYAAMDRRITVLKNKKNYYTDDGIYASKRAFWPEFDSEYVAIVDHDDILHPDFLKTLYPLGKMYHADQVIGGCTLFDNQTGELVRDRIPPDFHIDQIQDIGPYFYDLFSSICPQWGKLYATTLFDQYYEVCQDIPDEVEAMPDIWFSFSLLRHCQRIVGVHKSLIRYRVHQISQFYPEVPTKARIGEATYFFDYELRFLKDLRCDTEKNIDRLYHTHRSRMLDAVDIVKRSHVMTSKERVDYLQYILQEQFLQTYRELAMKKLQPRIQDCMKGIVEANGKEPELWQFYLYRLEYVRLYKIHSYEDLRLYIGALLCRDNSLGYGLEMMTEALWHQIPILDREKLTLGVPFFDTKYGLPSAEELLDAKRIANELDKQLSSVMEDHTYIPDLEWLETLEQYTLTSETGVLCRLILLIHRGEEAEAKRFSYIAQALWPENQFLQNICLQLK